MKRKLLPTFAGLFGLASFLALAPTLSLVKTAQAQPAQKHWVVVVSGRDRDRRDAQGRWLPPETFEVDMVSASSGAPPIQRGQDLASALAALVNEGAVITENATGYFTYVAVR